MGKNSSLLSSFLAVALAIEAKAGAYTQTSNFYSYGESNPIYRPQKRKMKPCKKKK